MKTHLNILNVPASEQTLTFSLFSKFFASSYQRNLTLSMLLICIVLLLLKIYIIKISNFLSEKIYGANKELKLTFNEFTISKFMAFENVKAHLFYKEDSYFKKKYGGDFNPEYFDMVLLKHEVLKILRNESDLVLKQIIVEKIKNLNEIKIFFMMKFISFMFCVAFSICVGMLFGSLYAELGLFKSLFALSIPFVIVFAMFVSIMFILGKERLNGQIKGENDNDLKVDILENGEKEGLIVLAKQTLR